MSVTLETIARDAACDAVVGLLDGGSVEFQTSAGAEVATLGLGTPAFGASVNGTAAAEAITSDTNATGGDIVSAVFKTSGGGDVFSVTVSGEGGGGVIELSSTSIGAGDTVTLNSYSHTQPA